MAARSRPKKPVVYWLENTIPLKYRDAIREGILMWNRAFERIGFEDAIEVRQQRMTPTGIRPMSVTTPSGGSPAAIADSPLVRRERIP